jgi:hypothetical protein
MMAGFAHRPIVAALISLSDTKVLLLRSKILPHSLEKDRYMHVE